MFVPGGGLFQVENTLNYLKSTFKLFSEWKLIRWKIGWRKKSYGSRKCASFGDVCVITSLKHEQASFYGKDGGLLISCLFWSWNCPNGGTHPLRLGRGDTFLNQQHLQALGSESHHPAEVGFASLISLYKTLLPFIFPWCRIQDYVQNRIVWELNVNFFFFTSSVELYIIAQLS